MPELSCSFAAITLPDPSVAQQPAEPKKISEAKLERIHRNNRRNAEEMMARDSRVVSARAMFEL